LGDVDAVAATQPLAGIELFHRVPVLSRAEGQHMPASRAVAIVALSVTAVLSAQTADWGRIGTVAPGQRITIETQDQKFVDGRFKSWSPDGIEILRGKRVASLAAPDVRRVSVHQKASRWKGAMWGAIFGFAALFPCGAASAGYVADTNNPRFGTRMEIGAAAGMFGAGIGAAIGALAGGTKSVTIYRLDNRR
jgi:hypothetical protein